MPQLKQLDVLNEKPPKKIQRGGRSHRLGHRQESLFLLFTLVGLFGHVLTEADLHATPAPSGIWF